MKRNKSIESHNILSRTVEASEEKSQSKLTVNNITVRKNNNSNYQNENRAGSKQLTKNQSSSSGIIHHPEQQ